MSYTVSIGLTPTFSISQDGTDLTSNFADRILSLTVISYSGGGVGDTLTLALDDRDWAIGLPSIGAGPTTLTVALGYKESGLWPMGEFQIRKAQPSFPPKTLVLVGTTVDSNTALKSPLITSHGPDATVNDIVGKIAFSAGVTPSVDPAIGDLAIKYLNQHSSGGHLLNEIERRTDGLAKFADGYLSLTQRGTGLNVSGVSAGNVFLDGTDIAQISIDIDNRHAYTKVRASYWDTVQHKLV